MKPLPWQWDRKPWSSMSLREKTTTCLRAIIFAALVVILFLLMSSAARANVSRALPVRFESAAIQSLGPPSLTIIRLLLRAGTIPEFGWTEVK